MVRCTRKGCGKEYEADKNEEGSCSYHSGGPVFHEGLKSWSCCKDVNKPVLDFDEFMKLPGCTQGRHTAEKAAEPALQTATVAAGPAVSASEATESNATSATPPPVNVTRHANGAETYSTGSTAAPSSAAAITATKPTPTPVVEDEDDIDKPVNPGAKCLRLGCGKPFVSQEESRLGEGEEATCVYHPSQPIFREGSKGYMCCKKRVLDFDDFLQIAGCKTGKHVFVKKARQGNVAEQVKCRIDHYQTPAQVFVSVFAKKVVKEESSVKYETDQVHLDLVLPDNKRFVRSLTLYGPIDPAASTHTFFGTKVELVLAKEDGRSWNLLEKPSDEKALPPGYGITFGVGGRTGTIGGKELHLDEDNKNKLKGV